MPLTTLIASFETEFDAETAFRELNLFATRVSTLICRYAMEVPAEKEREIAELLREQYEARVILSDKDKFRKFHPRRSA
jgi:hypothetical protein